MLVLWSKDSRNIEQSKRTLGTHKLGQEKKPPNS